MNTWEQLTIYVNESDRCQGKPLYLAIVEAACQQGLAGATVTRGSEGYGERQHHQIHTNRMMELADLPMVVTLIDRAEAIAHFLPIVQELVKVGLVTQDSVKVVHHAPIDEPT
jgi:PII-like signaling protein